SPRPRAGTLLLILQPSTYRLTCRLVPLPGVAPRAPLPLETTLTHSASLSLTYEVSLALRSASRLLCCVPDAAVVNSGSLKMTHEPASISVRVRFKDGLSVATFISVPARTLPELKVYSLPLRVRTTGGGGGGRLAPPAPNAPGPAAPPGAGPPGPAAAPGAPAAAAAPGPAPPTGPAAP